MRLTPSESMQAVEGMLARSDQDGGHTIEMPLSLLEHIVNVDDGIIPESLVTGIFDQLAAAHAASAPQTRIGLEFHQQMQDALMICPLIPDQKGNLHAVVDVGPRKAQQMAAKVMKLEPCPGGRRDELERLMFKAIMDVLETPAHMKQSAVLRYLLDFARDSQNDLVLCLLTSGSPNDSFATEFAEHISRCKVPLMPATHQAGFQQRGEGVRRYDLRVYTHVLRQLY